MHVRYTYSAVLTKIGAKKTPKKSRAIHIWGLLVLCILEGPQGPRTKVMKSIWGPLRALIHWFWSIMQCHETKGYRTHSREIEELEQKVITAFCSCWLHTLRQVSLTQDTITNFLVIRHNPHYCSLVCLGCVAMALYRCGFWLFGASAESPYCDLQVTRKLVLSTWVVWPISF